jgi:DNA repair exonuclease SbcCD nuclease subunit
MSKLLLADIHIKLGQKNVPREWALKRYDMFFDQVAYVEDDVDEIIIPGDLFDRMPTLDELSLYFKFISQRTKRTIISTGNHEATKKGKSFFTELKGVTERLNPNVEIVVDYIHESEDESYYVVPYEFVKNKSTWDDLDPRYVFTHVRGEIPPHVKPEINLDWLDKFPIVFAGDLHSHSNTQRNIVYPGSPMTTSFHRSEVQAGYIIIEDDWSWKWHAFDLPQLIRKTVSDPSEMVPTDFHHTIYELEGNIKDLSKIEHSDLLDKKLVKRSSDTALVLDKKMTISEELTEYLRYIQELPDVEIDNIMEVFNEYGGTSINQMG